MGRYLLPEGYIAHTQSVPRQQSSKLSSQRVPRLLLVPRCNVCLIEPPAIRHAFVPSLTASQLRRELLTSANLEKFIHLKMPLEHVLGWFLSITDVYSGSEGLKGLV